MAGQRTLPGLGLSAYWTPGSNGWNDQHDPDTRKVSAVCQLTVISRVAAVPGSPSNGDIHLLTTAPNENAVAVRDDGAWVYYTPTEGWIAYDRATDEMLAFNGTAWVVRQDLPAFSASNARQKLRVTAGGLLEWSYDPLGIRTVTADTTLVAADAGGYVRLSDVSALTLTVPTNATVPFEIGTVVHLRQVSIGQVTVVAAGGVTVNISETMLLRKQGSAASLLKVGTDEWDLTGDMEAAP